MLAACYYNIPCVKNRVYCKRLPQIGLSSPSSGTKRHKNHLNGALLVPSLSPCLWSRGGSCRGWKPAKSGPKNSFIPSSQRLHSELAITLCLGKFVGSCVQERISRSGDTKKFRHSFTATTLWVIKTIPGTQKNPNKPPKKPSQNQTTKPTQTQKNLGDMGTLFASNGLHNSLIYTKAFHKCRMCSLKKRTKHLQVPSSQEARTTPIQRDQGTVLNISPSFGGKKTHTDVRQSIRGMETLPGAGRGLNTPGQHGVKSQQDFFFFH